MISNIYAESITIYATQSASYRASGSGSSGCCSLNSIGYNNSNTLGASSCTWWSQYGQCERRTSYPVWSFNFLQLPSNATVVSVSFNAEGLYDEWHDSYMVRCTRAQARSRSATQLEPVYSRYFSLILAF